MTRLVIWHQWFWEASEIASEWQLKRLGWSLAESVMDPNYTDITRSEWEGGDVDASKGLIPECSMFDGSWVWRRTRDGDDSRVMMVQIDPGS